MKDDIKKYGREVFSLEILYTNVPNDQLDDLERDTIQKYNALNPNGYNLDPGGYHNKSLGVEHRRNISESLKGRAFSAEHRKALSEAMKGNANGQHKTMSSEERRKLSKVHKGKTVSAETRRKQSESAKRKPPITPETRAKLSEASKQAWARKKQQAP